MAQVVDTNSRRRLPILLRASYGVGHVLNDVCASMWFTYLLVWFHLVLQFDSALSGIVLLIGQVADAISTPFVGIESDRRDNFWLCRYGRRKTWHLFGTICVIGSFPFIFMPCISCQDSHHWAQLIYYAAFVVIFQFGWASVQISHLSLIPDLTPDEHERTELTAIRYSFTVVSNVLVYLVTWGVLHVTNENEDDQIGPKDVGKFQHIALIGIAIGVITSIVFHAGVKEEREEEDDEGLQLQRRGSIMTASKFLQEGQFYQVALLYMATRLYVNLVQVYVPLYLHKSLLMPAENLAIIPLVMFLSSFVFSFVIKYLNKHWGRKISFILGCLVGIAPCIWVWFGEGERYNTYEIYPVAILFGAGSSIMLVTSLGVTADYIAHNTESGAFVYGAMSFADKLSNGLAVAIIQDFKCLITCPHYYRDVLTFVCGGSAAFGLLVLLTLVPFEIGRRRRGEVLRAPYLVIENDHCSLEDSNQVAPSSENVTETDEGNGAENVSVQAS
ncbi:major facilitator superfamily domain-containing protein 12-like [Ischnura elegans]|uniref:major facilitator superfamily domain-containing protein 12-like n=1 Tax=Ischnura elegans TaxID=197161 RepID=UPI001ED8877F|nr:major facilitator superfamily domain-containing protein 12-like [Ischnura elegans]